MTQKTSLKEMNKKMRDLDLCMMTTITSRGMTASRPMSNNSDVDYDGTSYFFVNKKTRVVSDLKKNKHVNLSFSGSPGLLGKSPNLFVSVSGVGKLITDITQMEKHWTPDLEIWFKDGVETPGLTMIEVKASHIKFWEKGKEGEVALSKKTGAKH